MADQRLTWLTRRPTVWSAVVPLVALLAGGLFATSAATARGTNLRSSASDLPDLIRDRTRSNAQSAREVRRLQAQVDRLSAAAAPGNTRLTQLTREAAAIGASVGTLPVEGPALRVALTDAVRPGGQVPEGFTPDDVVVHQQDVQGVVNALWSAGAEAMTLMDQRVISTSAVRCVGNTLILQGRVYSPPYVITAIGDQAQLRRALENSRAVQIYQQYVAAVGLGYEVTALQAVQMPAYAGPVRLSHAEVTR